MFKLEIKPNVISPCLYSLQVFKNKRSFCNSTCMYISKSMKYYFVKGCPGAGEQTRDLSISFIFSLHHLTAEPQRLPMDEVLFMFKCDFKYLFEK
jgi:hypothetical protein